MKTRYISSHPAIRRFWWGLLPLLMLVALIAFFLRPDEPLAAPDDPPAPRVEVMTLSPVSYYTVEQRFLGKIEARRTSQLGFELGGTVETIGFEEGDPVSQGETVATLNDDRLQARKSEVQAALNEARAAETLAESNFNRTRQLIRDKVATPAELDSAIKERDAAQATVRQIEAQLDSIQVDLGETGLLAPFDGVIQTRMKDEGAVVTAGQPVLEVMESGHHEIRAGLSPAIAQSLTAGDQVEVFIGDETPLDATVMRKLPIRSNETRTVDVILSLASDGLLPGDLVEIPFQRREASRGYWLPLSALTESQRGLWACFVLHSDPGQAPKLDRRQVEILHQTADSAFVRGALQSGDEVVVDGLQKLTPGLTVHPTPHQNSGS